MILPLRRRHRRLVPAIALLTALLLGWALAARHDPRAGAGTEAAP